MTAQIARSHPRRSRTRRGRSAPPRRATPRRTSPPPPRPRPPPATATDLSPAHRREAEPGGGDRCDAGSSRGGRTSKPADPLPLSGLRSHRRDLIGVPGALLPHPQLHRRLRQRHLQSGRSPTAAATPPPTRRSCSAHPAPRIANDSPRLLISREVVLAAQPVVVPARWMRDRGIDIRWRGRVDRREAPLLVRPAHENPHRLWA
jgi:hypothetical protein